ncbi:MAG: glycosyltransferase family 4 protein [Thermodesulfobacteriota bacterium]
MTERWRILLLSRYGPLGASSRLRFYQYLPFLEEAGAEVTVAPFFEDGYLDRLYASGERRFRDVTCAYLRRIRALLGAGRCSVAWVEKELFPFLPGGFERLPARAGAPLVVDYDDAVFHTYDLHASPWVRRLLGRKLDPLLARARIVVAGSAYLESYARSRGARDVRRIPTVVDIRRYDAVEAPASGEFRIGWIGSASTTKFLYMVRDALKALSAERPIRLVTIGASPLPGFDVPLEQHPWSECDEARLLGSVHVGIMPLPDEPWERGKCGYKLVQYMACGKPVVAAPVGANRDIVTAAVGYLADGREEWVRALRALAEDDGLRRACGAAARERVEREYSLQAAAPRVVDLLREAAGLSGRTAG